MKKLLALFIIFASINVSAAGIASTKDLHSACTYALSNPTQAYAVDQAKKCFLFLEGFDSGRTIAKIINETPDIYCPPQDSNMRSMVKTVANYLNRHKDLYSSPAGWGAYQALSNTWPCK